MYYDGREFFGRLKRQVLIIIFVNHFVWRRILQIGQSAAGTGDNAEITFEAKKSVACFRTIRA